MINWAFSALSSWDRSITPRSTSLSPIRFDISNPWDARLTTRTSDMWEDMVK